jgi:hypothetical protein
MSAEPTTVRLGRFTARIVPPPHPLYHGGRHDWSRPRHDYERGVIVEIYDTDHPHTALGQFVSSYNAETLADLRPGVALSLHGGIPAWTLSPEEVDLLRPHLAG